MAELEQSSEGVVTIDGKEIDRLHPLTVCWIRNRQAELFADRVVQRMVDRAGGVQFDGRVYFGSPLVPFRGQVVRVYVRENRVQGIDLPHLPGEQPVAVDMNGIFETSLVQCRNGRAC
jgi:Mu transposase, C-terminal